MKLEEVELPDSTPTEEDIALVKTFQIQDEKEYEATLLRVTRERQLKSALLELSRYRGY